MNIVGQGRTGKPGAMLVLAAAILNALQRFSRPVMPPHFNLNPIVPAVNKITRTKGPDYYRQNGPQECARRRRQIEKGILKVM